MERTYLQDAHYSFIARRNNSLSSSDRILAFGFIALICLGIAVGFACLGAWLVLPFAGAEVLLLSLAFFYMERHAYDYERLTIDGDDLQIERLEVKRVQRFRFNRWWANVFYECASGRLVLRSQGREIEFGRHLTAAGRLEAAADIKRRLHSR